MIERSGERNLSALPHCSSMGKLGFCANGRALAPVFTTVTPATDSSGSIRGVSPLKQLELTDLDIDRQLLDLPGTSLLVFTSLGCTSCRWARQYLPTLALALDRLCWIDAADNGGAVERYEVFHLPALFVIRDGDFYGALRAPLTAQGIDQGLREVLQAEPDELP